VNDFILGEEVMSLTKVCGCYSVTFLNRTLILINMWIGEDKE
jgi:hypothetical protein